MLELCIKNDRENEKEVLITDSEVQKIDIDQDTYVINFQMLDAPPFCCYKQ